MLDLQNLRSNCEAVKRALARKKFNCDLDQFLELDEQRRERVRAFEALRARLKASSEQVMKLEKGSAEFQEETAQLRQLSKETKQLEGQLKELEGRWKEAYLTIPNVPHESVPAGRGPQDNVVVHVWGDVSRRTGVPHYEIPGFEKGLDFSRGAKVTGAGFPFYIGSVARLVRSLIAFFLDEAAARGYQELMPPILVNEASATATGQLPDKEAMMYDAPVDGFYLVPTAEVPVTNFFRGEVLEASQLPLYRAAYTPCFRREAGSWGKDVRGLNRLHQFDKVELVKWVLPETSFAELESLRGDAELLLQKLELPYRLLSICSGDIGFPHAKQYDLEVWSSGQGRWLEVSSCSNFTDFQARRANIRYRAESGRLEFVHTLNGSGLAIPRVLAALLENNLQEDGTVRVPAILEKWFGGDRLVFGD